jgi:hypothetical protein
MKIATDSAMDWGSIAIVVFTAVFVAVVVLIAIRLMR